MESIIVAVITGGLALVGTVISNLMAHGKTIYRIEQLEKKQDIHNGIIDRMYGVESAVKVLEERQKTANHRIEDLETFEHEVEHVFIDGGTIDGKSKFSN